MDLKTFVTLDYYGLSIPHSCLRGQQLTLDPDDFALIIVPWSMALALFRTFGHITRVGENCQFCVKLAFEIIIPPKMLGEEDFIKNWLFLL